VAVQYWTRLKRIIARPHRHTPPALGNMSQVSSELLFFNDEEVILVRLNQSRNRCINRLIHGRVVPTISDNSSCEIFSSMRMLRGSFLPSVRASVYASHSGDFNPKPIFFSQMSVVSKLAIRRKRCRDCSMNQKRIYNNLRSFLRGSPPS
jgi:hypothetical protein